MTDAIRAAANALAGARQKTIGTARTLAEAQLVSDNLKARVTALETERAGIIAAARGGRAHDPAHALRVGVIDADISDLAPLTEDANAGVAAAQAQNQEAVQAVMRAEHQFSMATDAEFERRLAEHAGKLEALLPTTLAELNAVGKRVGRARSVWFPSPETATAIQKLHLMATGVRR
jgi:hypothetical protein